MLFINNLISLTLPIFLLLNFKTDPPTPSIAHFLQLHAIFFENFSFFDGLRGAAEEFALIFFVKHAAPVEMRSAFGHFQKRIIYGCIAFIGITVACQLFQNIPSFQGGVGLFAVVMPIGLLAIIAFLLAAFYCVALVRDMLKLLMRKKHA
ncbi:hypothetical protein [Candidatus Sarmatiella mevalonica]|uniref:hypothetical protein n=1 Tax=Candidatus Sarmatiella mevalonica TaxID=2770581 RepID=UPI0019238DD6|nr:hypothetical protein [Candidatus Sarmatiella mevalonica]